MRYNKDEGQYSRDGVPQRMGHIVGAMAVVFAVVVGVVALMRIDFGSEAEEIPVRNQDLYLMGVSSLEHVATVSKKKSDKEGALYLLFETYKKRSVLNLYDFYLNHKGEKYTDEALDIVVSKCDSLYQVALRKNTEQGWSDYLVTVPEDFWRDAQDRYNEFKWEHTAELWDTEEKAWEQVEALRGAGAYQRYLTLYPNAPHTDEAAVALKRMKQDEQRREWNKDADRRRYKRWENKINRYRKRGR